jgi:hypothetical protein
LASKAIAASAWSAAPPEVVYGLLCSGATWPQWTPLGSFELERPDEHGGEGIGAIRVFRTGPIRSREQVVGLESNRRFSYEFLSGLPIRKVHADVELTGGDGGTAIAWSETFEPRVVGTGWLFRRLLRRVIQQCADGLGVEAARIAGAAPGTQERSSSPDGSA